MLVHTNKLKRRCGEIDPFLSIILSRQSKRLQKGCTVFAAGMANTAVGVHRMNGFARFFAVIRGLVKIIYRLRRLYTPLPNPAAIF